MRQTEDEVIISMPIYNESEGIVEFLSEIQEAFRSVKLEFVLVDDASTDQSVNRVKEFMNSTSIPVQLILNSTNLGHGPSTILGIDAAIKSGKSVIMTVDGDGQFHGSDLRKLFDLFRRSEFSVIEGVRTNRTDPFFRILTTFLTRLLVFIRCHKMPKDANSPLRIYACKDLNVIRNRLQDGLLTPNLHISALVRGKDLDFKIGNLEVQSLARRGTSTTGTMWQGGKSMIPSKRFIAFILKSFKQWIFTNQAFVVKRRRAN